MLPQQSLMLRVAAEAIGDASWDAGLSSRTGVLIGIGLDLNTTNYYLRWSLPDKARRWNQDLGLDLSAEELVGWIDELQAAAGPALSANRTMGSLGGVVASRIAGIPDRRPQLHGLLRRDVRSPGGGHRG